MLDNKSIVFVHGIGSKPDKHTLLNLWTKCLKANIELTDKIFYAQVKEELDNVFKMVYWADVIPTHVHDTPEWNAYVETRVNDLIEKRIKEKFHVGLGDSLQGFIVDKALDLADILTTALTIKDNVMNAVIDEVRLYSTEVCVATEIRKILTTTLNYEGVQDKKIALVTHSMGTFIAYDVLWQQSHRYNDFRTYIDLFVTMGSPLGDPVIQDFLLGSKYGKKEERRYPTNIGKWHNYSCLGDIVAHDSTLGDDFHDSMVKLGLLSSKDNARDYTNLYNPYITPSGKPNPHEVCGYLLQPKLAKWIIAFLKDEL